MNNAAAFLAQNDLSAATLTAKQVAPYAQHHSGGLVVLAGYDKVTGQCVKMHDSWGDDGEIVLHTYDPNADDESETMVFYGVGSTAFARFLEAIGEN